MNLKILSEGKGLSIGIGGKAKIVLEDDQYVIYDYSGYNLNVPEHMNSENVRDGFITIQKNCFVEPDIHEKVKKWPSGRKELISKRVHVQVPFDEFFSQGFIKVENCRHCWEKRDDGVDVIAMHILFKIFDDYQESGKIPEWINYFV